MELFDTNCSVLFMSYGNVMFVDNVRILDIMKILICYLSDMRKGTLVIQNISQVQLGEYKCEASNGVGSATCTVDLSEGKRGGREQTVLSVQRLEASQWCWFSCIS